MEDNSERMALPGVQPADTMAHHDPVKAADAAIRTFPDREDHCLPLAQRHHHGARLGPWTLLYQDELTTGEIRPGFAQEDRELQGKHMLPIQILMQAVEATGVVAQQQRRWAGLSGFVAARQIFGMGVGEGAFLPQIPPLRVGDDRQRRIQLLPQSGHDLW